MRLKVGRGKKRWVGPREKNAARWRFGVKYGFPTFWVSHIGNRRIRRGWRHPMQEPPNGVSFNPRDYPYYKTAEAAMDAAIAKARGGR